MPKEALSVERCYVAANPGEAIATASLRRDEGDVGGSSFLGERPMAESTSVVEDPASVFAAIAPGVRRLFADVRYFHVRLGLATFYKDGYDLSNPKADYLVPTLQSAIEENAQAKTEGIFAIGVSAADNKEYRLKLKGDGPKLTVQPLRNVHTNPLLCIRPCAAIDFALFSCQTMEAETTLPQDVRRAASLAQLCKKMLTGEEGKAKAEEIFHLMKKEKFEKMWISELQHTTVAIDSEGKGLVFEQRVDRHTANANRSLYSSVPSGRKMGCSFELAPVERKNIPTADTHPQLMTLIRILNRASNKPDFSRHGISASRITTSLCLNVPAREDEAAINDGEIAQLSRIPSSWPQRRTVRYHAPILMGTPTLLPLTEAQQSRMCKCLEEMLSRQVGGGPTTEKAFDQVPHITMGPGHVAAFNDCRAQVAYVTQIPLDSSFTGLRDEVTTEFRLAVRFSTNTVGCDLFAPFRDGAVVMNEVTARCFDIQSNRDHVILLRRNCRHSVAITPIAELNADELPLTAEQLKEALATLEFGFRPTSPSCFPRPPLRLHETIKKRQFPSGDFTHTVIHRRYIHGKTIVDTQSYQSFVEFTDQKKRDALLSQCREEGSMKALVDGLNALITELNVAEPPLMNDTAFVPFKPTQREASHNSLKPPTAQSPPLSEKAGTADAVPQPRPPKVLSESERWLRVLPPVAPTADASSALTGVQIASAQQQQANDVQQALRGVHSLGHESPFTLFFYDPSQQRSIFDRLSRVERDCALHHESEPLVILPSRTVAAGGAQLQMEPELTLHIPPEVSTHAKMRHYNLLQAAFPTSDASISIFFTTRAQAEGVLSGCPLYGVCGAVVAFNPTKKDVTNVASSTLLRVRTVGSLFSNPSRFLKLMKL